MSNSTKPTLMDRVGWRLAGTSMAVRATAASHRNSSGPLPYFGTVGVGNLGDNVLFDVARHSFPGHSLVPIDGRRRSHRALLKTLARRNRSMLVGGGTLLLSPPLLATLRLLPRLDMEYSTLGTGAHDPSFIGELPNEIASDWREALLSCTRLGVRGCRTAATVSALGVAGAEPVGDPALVMSLSREPRRTTGRTLGVNLGTAFGAVWGGDEAAGIDGVVEGLRELQRRGWGIRLLGVWGPDVRVLREVAARLGVPNGAIATEFHSAHRFMDLVQDCDVFVGMKLHAQVLAMCAGVPTVPLEYQPKTSEVLAALDSDFRPVQLQDVAPKVLVDEVERVRDDADNVRMEQWTRCRASAGAFLDYLDSIGGDSSALTAWVAAR